MYVVLGIKFVFHQSTIWNHGSSGWTMHYLLISPGTKCWNGTTNLWIQTWTLALICWFDVAALVYTVISCHTASESTWCTLCTNQNHN